MITHFHNVMITIEGSSPEAAFLLLCERLNHRDIEYTTDTYRAAGHEEKKSTYNFFLKLGKGKSE